AAAIGDGEFQKFLGSITVQTNDDGNVVGGYSATFADANVPADSPVSATATDQDGNTTGFAKAIKVTSPGVVVAAPPAPAPPSSQAEAPAPPTSPGEAPAPPTAPPGSAASVPLFHPTRLGAHPHGPVGPAHPHRPPHGGHPPQAGPAGRHRFPLRPRHGA